MKLRHHTTIEALLEMAMDDSAPMWLSQIYKALLAWKNPTTQAPLAWKYLSSEVPSLHHCASVWGLSVDDRAKQAICEIVRKLPGDISQAGGNRM